MEETISERVLASTIESAQMIDQLTAKGIMFVMLIFSLLVCFMLFRWIFSFINSMQEQVKFNEKIELNMEKIANSVSQSLEFLKEDLKEQKMHNEILKTQISNHTNTIVNELKEVENRLYRVLRLNRDKGGRNEL